MKIKKDNRDEIIKICDELENKKKHTLYNFEPMESTIDTLRFYIDNNYNILLKYKAQVEYNYNFEEITMSSIALIISVCSLLVSISSDISIILFVCISLLIIFIACRIHNHTIWGRKRWLTYIKYALEDIEKNFEHKKTEQ